MLWHQWSAWQADFYYPKVETMKAIIGTKLGMTTIYDEQQGAINVTLVQCQPNTVRFVRTPERDGYAAVQLEAPKTAKKTLRREFRLADGEEAPTEGDTVTVEIFSVGDTVKVSGVTKAKGFQGVVKRHGFAGGPASHGHRHVLRQAGSIGSAYPQHVRKGTRMAGRMGGVRHTTRGLTIVHVDVEKGLVAIRGAVPGVNGRIVEIVKD